MPVYKQLIFNESYLENATLKRFKAAQVCLRVIFGQRQQDMSGTVLRGK